MKQTLARLLVIAIASTSLPAVATASAVAEMEPDLDLGKRLHRQCALCHGLHSQGILGGKYPRIAGFPEYYLHKALLAYRDGKRQHAAMAVVGGLRSLSDQDLYSLAAYIASIDLDAVHPLSVPTPDGADVEAGSQLYRGDCRTCHGRNGEGMERKESPPLRGQYDGYLFRQIELFKAGKRIHANDPEDRTFEGYTDQEILDIIGFVTTLDKK